MRGFMSSVNYPASSTPVESDSYCTRVQNCLRSRKTIQNAKITLWCIGGAGSAFIPVPFLSGLLMGGGLFMASHEMAQHPDSNYMSGALRPMILSRTWKHIATGTATTGIGWGLGTLALSASLPGLFATCAIGSLAVGCKIAYSDVLFPSGPTRMNPTPLDHQRFVPDDSEND